MKNINLKSMLLSTILSILFTISLIDVIPREKEIIHKPILINRPYTSTICRCDREDNVINEQTDIQEKLYHDKFTNETNIKNKSGLTASQINTLLEGTELYGIGEYINEVENTYGISSFFTIAVAVLESGYGTSNLAKNYNNIFGMIYCTFNSIESCVDYFGKLMNEYENEYNIEMNVKSIGARYCEDFDWSDKVVRIMNQYVMKVNNIL